MRSSRGWYIPRPLSVLSTHQILDTSIQDYGSYNHFILTITPTSATKWHVWFHSAGVLVTVCILTTYGLFQDSWGLSYMHTSLGLFDPELCRTATPSRPLTSSIDRKVTYVTWYWYCTSIWLRHNNVRRIPGPLSSVLSTHHTLDPSTRDMSSTIPYTDLFISHTKLRIDMCYIIWCAHNIYRLQTIFIYICHW